MRGFYKSSALLCMCLMLSGHAMAARQLKWGTMDTLSPTYETPSPSYSPDYPSPSPSKYYPSPSPDYTPSPSYPSPSPCPSPSPSYEYPSPVYTPPSPSYEEYSSPVYTPPSPSYEEYSSPVYTPPSPSYEEYSSPVYTPPSPSYEEYSSPVYTPPSPSYEEYPSPVYTPPSPSYEESSDGEEYPSPAYTYPSPSYEESSEEVYQETPVYKRMMTEKYSKDGYKQDGYKQESYKHEGRYSAYPVCSLPAPYETRKLHTSFSYEGEFKACVELAGKKVSNQVQAFDLAALQLVVSDKCHHAVKSITFDGKRVKPELTQYQQEHNIGVKISGYQGDVLATYRDLYKSPVKVCITLKFPCANQDSLYNIVTYFAEGYNSYEGANYCATTSLFNNYQPTYHKEQYKHEEPKYPTPSQKY